MDISKNAGHVVMDMRADKTYTRHSEGAFLRMNDGSILYAYSRFTGNSNDAAPCDIVGRWSYDEGKTWSDAVILLHAADFGTHNIMSVSLMRMQNGDVGIFFGSRQQPNIGFHHLALSNDECKTFYQSSVCSPADRPGYYVLNNDRVVRLKSGRLVMPTAFHRGGYDWNRSANASDCAGGQHWYFDLCGVLCFRLSDDDGKTWREAPDTVHPPFVSRNGLQEPGVIELENGVLWAWARTDMMYQYECFSFDGGEHWTQAQPSRFTSPRSPMQVKRNPADGSLIAVWNPIPNYNGRKQYAGFFEGRTPIVYARSTDDGKTWSEPVVIEGAEDCGYCYPCIFFTNDNSILVGYCSGSPEDGDCLASSTVRKIQL